MKININQKTKSQCEILMKKIQKKFREENRLMRQLVK